MIDPVAELVSIQAMLVEGADIAERDGYDNNVMGEAAYRLQAVIDHLKGSQDS